MRVCSENSTIFVSKSTNIQMGKKLVIIGGGFSSLAASCYLAKDGFDVTIL
jgi:NADPH-dependent 2,4-dienoyl-CoA reductase/sulfur reductase-like enzyme